MIHRRGQTSKHISCDSLSSFAPQNRNETLTRLAACKTLGPKMPHCKRKRAKLCSWPTLRTRLLWNSIDAT